jgi:hypothetical protein
MARITCFFEEFALGIRTNDIQTIIRDIQLEEQHMYKDFINTGKVAPLCGGCQRTSQCYRKDGVTIQGLRDYPK